MIVVSSENIHGKRIVSTLGLVRGSTVRCRHVGKDILAFLRNLVGGEVEEYTKMLAEAREQSIDRMIFDAKRLGANAITDSCGQSVSLYEYYPFGSIRTVTGTVECNKLYTGQEYNEETGLNDFDFRHQNPRTFIFVKADNLGCVLADIWNHFR